MKSNNAVKLRKGAWSSDEDTLLRKCIQKYGEGKWHLVPQRAGLNRCRKSCRLRWLNYLRPEINSGNFGADEVDLMIYHGLQRVEESAFDPLKNGERDHLRLPGRTANDIKNYWNTNVRKKLTTAISFHKEVIEKEMPIERKQDTAIATNSTGTNVVTKPIPWTLSKGTTIPCYNLNPIGHLSSRYENNNNNDGLINRPSSPATLPQDENGMEWWKNMFAEMGMHGEEETSTEGLLMEPTSGLEDRDAERGLIWTPDESTAACLIKDGDWSDIWDFLNSESNS